MRTFKLYPEERHWWSMNDYGAVVDAMAELRAHDFATARVLEFGPGSSTLALVEGGAETIDTCEDNPDWAQVYEARLVPRFPTPEFAARIALHRYVYGDPLRIPAIDDRRYDLALIDGPLGTDHRPAVVRYALARCRAVLVPTEDKNPAFRRMLHAIADELGWRISVAETGPLSGGFALFTPSDQAADPETDEPPAQAPTAPGPAPARRAAKRGRAARKEPSHGEHSTTE